MKWHMGLELELELELSFSFRLGLEIGLELCTVVTGCVHWSLNVNPLNINCADLRARKKQLLYGHNNISSGFIIAVISSAFIVLSDVEGVGCL